MSAEHEWKIKAPCYSVNSRDGTELILVPGGRFWVGSEEEDGDAYDDEKPRHLHCISPYYIGIYCITVAQFSQFVEQTEHEAGDQWRQDPADHPVRYVNWYDVKTYCDWAKLRLPYEAEWELAARGYTGLRFPWGNHWEQGSRVSWSDQEDNENSTESVYNHPDGSSPLGTFQQSGNVWEWCMDAWDDISYKRFANGDYRIVEKSGTRVRGVRGASWSDRDPREFRGPHRSFSLSLKDRYSNFGFRVAKSLVE